MIESYVTHEFDIYNFINVFYNVDYVSDSNNLYVNPYYPLCFLLFYELIPYHLVLYKLIYTYYGFEKYIINKYLIIYFLIDLILLNFLLLVNLIKR